MLYTWNLYINKNTVEDISSVLWVYKKITEFEEGAIGALNI